jgi:CHAT domain-containing protein/tetratricopeptide (TPR) repeat protein
MTRGVAVLRVGLVLAGVGLLGVEAAQAQEIRDRETLGREYERAHRLRQEGKPAAALPVAQRVAEAAEKLLGADAEITAQCQNLLAILFVETGQYAQAEPLFQRSLRTREARLGKDHPDTAQSLHNLANVYKAMGQYAQAEPLYQRSLQIYETKLGKDHPSVAANLNNLAVLYKEMGQYAQAEPLFQRSLQIREAKLGKDHPEVASSLQNLANLYKEMGQYAKAEPLYLRSLQAREAKLGKDHPHVANSLNDLARLYQTMGRYAQAEPLHRRSLQIFEDKLGKDHPSVAASLNNLGGLYWVVGRYAQAEPLFRRSLHIFETQLGKEHPDVARGLDNLALLFETTSQTIQAADLVDRARRLFRRHMTRVLVALSEQEQVNFLRHKDGPSWHRALSLGLRHPDDEKLLELSAAWLDNGKGTAQQTLAQAALLARDSRDPELGKLSHRLQQARQELTRLTLNPPQGEQVQQRQRRLDELSRQEQDLSKRLRRAGGGGEDEAWVDLDTLRQALPPGSVLVELACFDLFDFKAVEGQPKWQPARYAAWIIPPAGPVRLLDLGPAEAIDKVVQQVRQALQDAPKAIRLKGEADAEKAVREPLEALAKKVLHPLLPHIGKSKRWVLSPDGNLWLAPWAALPLPDGRYAVEQHTLSYVISGRDLVQSPPAQAVPAAPLVLADPDFDLDPAELSRVNRRPLREQEAPAETRGLSQALRLGRIQRLPGTAAEAQAIKDKLRAYAGVAPRVLTDKDATVSLFQAVRNPRVVVLSTHGYFLPDQEAEPDERDRPGRPNAAPQGLRLENPLLRCGLLLAGCNNAARAPANGDNGVLTGLQIIGTDLRGCELVVLSACETGLGEVRNGQGVAGLRQAFQLAGAQSVVATLWQVPDQQTAQLMAGFFNNLAGKYEKAEALRNAQLALIKARRDKTAAAHPYFWAAFTVTGR